MSDHAVVHFEIAGPDGKALQDFYAKLFGWTINADNPMNYGLVFKMDNGIGGGIVKPSMGSATKFVTRASAKPVTVSRRGIEPSMAATA